MFSMFQPRSAHGEVRVEVRQLQAWCQGNTPRDSLPAAVGEGGRSAWEAKRAAMERVRKTHFSYDGVLRHVWRWLEDPASADLYCTVAVRPVRRMMSAPLPSLPHLFLRSLPCTLLPAAHLFSQDYTNFRRLANRA